jgi:RNA ligase
MTHYFPIIRNIQDVLPAIEGRDEFAVVDKNGYTVINYHVMMLDSFDCSIRRECRGIIFDSNTGEILRRPLHKFFNVNEREETLLKNLDFTGQHWVDTKLDGSMIAVFKHCNELIYGTKMVAEDFDVLVKQFVRESSVDYQSFCEQVIDAGYTPIFEFMHPLKRIVIDYGKPALTLLAVRNMITGEFANF